MSQSETSATGFGSWITVTSRVMRAMASGSAGQIPTEPMPPKAATRVTGTPWTTSCTVRADVFETSTRLSTCPFDRSLSHSSCTTFSMPPGAGG